MGCQEDLSSTIWTCEENDAVLEDLKKNSSRLSREEYRKRTQGYARVPKVQNCLAASPV
jgi:hypothetical protein